MKWVLWFAATASWAAGCDSPQSHQLDFWLGEWDVEVGGQVLARSRIEKLAGGCIVLENSMPFSGGEGKSWNFYNPATSQWEQVWLTGQGDVLKVAGEWKDGAIREAGQSQSGGRTALHRHSFTPLSGRKVRQFCEESDYHAQTWHVVFEGIYITRKP